MAHRVEEVGKRLKCIPKKESFLVCFVKYLFYKILSKTGIFMYLKPLAIYLFLGTGRDNGNVCRVGATT